ncbi:MAG TPA: hypothetical protein DDW52_27400 [Planctomycetaceae bacterium]|nr:hypothetical protein [Planctomycetaceae bacterium]
MTALNRLVARSLRYFSRSHIALSAGVAAAVAVIVGALIIGDSVRRSLRGMVLDRLAQVQCLLHARTFFSPDMLAAAASSSEDVDVHPAILLPRSTVEYRADDGLARASNVQLLAGPNTMWPSASGQSEFLSLAEDEVALNQSLAQELNVTVGEEISLRISNTPGVAADNPLGRSDDSVVNLPRQRVVAILPDDSFGGVRFEVTQSAPRNVFCALATVQDILEVDDRINAAVVTSKALKQEQAEDFSQLVCDTLNLNVRPTLEDFGLTINRHTQQFDGKTIFDYYQISSDELILDRATDDALKTALGQNAMQTLAYLANGIQKTRPTVDDLSRQRNAYDYEARRQTIESGSRPARPRGIVGESVRLADAEDAPDFDEQDPEPPEEPEEFGREVPYSLVVGVDAKLMGLDEYSELGLRELQIPYCWISSWLADEAEVKPGDWIRLRYFEPETVEGKAVETSMNFMVAGIVPITKPSSPYRSSRPAKFSEPPTRFNDPNLTPSVPGVTDQDSISKWDLPFPIEDDLLLDQDDEYWNDYRLTPKVFAPHHLLALNALFGSRFGKTSAIRIDVSFAQDENALRQAAEEALLVTRPEKGLLFRPVRMQQLQASSGATPFDMLFLSLSFFVIVAALVLVVLLLKLGLERRAEQLGVLFSQGFTPARVRAILLREYAIVAAAGAVAGAALGIGYAKLMIVGLQTWWVGAIATPFLKFTFGPQSLVVGLLAGLFTSLVVLFWGLNRISHVPALRLLRGDASNQHDDDGQIRKPLLALAGVLLVVAGGLVVWGSGLSGMARAGTFFGSGMLVLLGLLIIAWQLLRRRQASQASLGLPLPVLAFRAIRRNPLRTVLSLTLLSVASFLIASMGAFQVDPSERGYGGFDLIGESSQPIFDNIGASSVREDVIGPNADAIRGINAISMRMLPGEDASCNNLYQVARPTVLGVPARLRRMADLSTTTVGFDWAAAESQDNPWRALEKDASGTLEAPIPVILDQNTAAWSLKQGAGLGQLITMEVDSKKIHFQTVGLLSNSVLQGKLLIAEENFERIFPQVSGYRYFMVRTSGADPQKVTTILEDGWSDAGLDISYSKVKLAELLGVQNTYISAFQTLGTLGLLLGTFGLAAVQLRNIVERRSELALMQAVGFSKSRIANMLAIETATILCLGLGIGSIAALVALLPNVIGSNQDLSILTPLLSLIAVVVIGFIVGALAARQATNVGILDGLRSE